MWVGGEAHPQEERVNRQGLPAGRHPGSQPLADQQKEESLVLALEDWAGWHGVWAVAQSGGQAWWAAQSRSGTTPACNCRMEPTLSRCMIWCELPQ